jgi:hypothetical protein
MENIKAFEEHNMAIEAELPVRMTDKEHVLFAKVAGNANIYIEFGSGGSTYWMTRQSKAEYLYSIESDRCWLQKLESYSAIKEALRSRRLTFLYANIGPTKEWGYPEGEYSIPLRANGLHPYGLFYSNYYWAPWEFLPKNADCILVDGRFRVACCLMSAIMTMNDKCDFIVHDYSDRPHYHIIEKFFDEQEKAGSLSVFKKKCEFDIQSAMITLSEYIYVPA